MCNDEYTDINDKLSVIAKKLDENQKADEKGD